ncbi:hypothetical protein [Sporosalibacterium faouarense]|uniref:hypothetical protein n=1 Tax=Sporosalibacterium faouarense TaxID=516123 RepID=UPI00141D5C26|nr:hypothetical protein [Sporosalibacterium faouarense]MTI49092.1 hypothetical protein [Bacillota bacterium]
MSSVYNDLTLAMKRKTDRIESIKKKIKNKEVMLTVSRVLIYSSVILLIFQLNSLWNKTLSALNNSTFIDSNAILSLFSSLSALQLYTIIILVISIIFHSLYLKSLANLNKEYNSLRIDIISSLERKFCEHKEDCNCKTNYIKYMDELNIDVIFK